MRSGRDTWYAIGMELAEIIAKQACVMYLLMFVGAVAFRKKILSGDTVSQMSDLLAIVVTPAVIIQAFQVKFETSLARGLLVAAGLSALAHFIGIAVSYIAVRKGGKSRAYLIERLAVIFSNCGFVGIPLVSAVFGNAGVFYCSAYIATYNILFWTYGIATLEGSLSPKGLAKVLLSPQLIGIAAGLAFFFCSVRLPSILLSATAQIANLNTPLAMVVIGTYVARTNILRALSDLRVYFVSALRLILVPALFLIPLRMLKIDPVISGSIMITAACPVGAMTLVLANQYDADPLHASRLISLSTLASIVTIPLALIALHV